MEDFRESHLKELQQEFKNDIEEFLQNTGWKTASKAAQQSGLYTETISRVLNKEYFLQHDDIDAMLQAAHTTEKITHEEFWLWHEKLHKLVIYKNLLGAVFKERSKGNIDKLVEAERLAHNEDIYGKIKKDPYLKEVSEKLYQWGGQTWSIIGICWIATQIETGVEVTNLRLPSSTEILRIRKMIVTDWEEWIDIFGTMNELVEFYTKEVKLGTTIQKRVIRVIWHNIRRMWEFIT